MNSNESFHTPVLLEESIDLMAIKEDGIYIDGTLGEGGHSSYILKKLGLSGTLISFDHDVSAIQYVKEKYSSKLTDGRWKLVNSNFSKMDQYVEKESVDGIILDLGISSRHIDIPGKGFSFKNEDDPLDMRMDETLGVTASDLLNILSWKQLAELFEMYGEERYARRIAKSIKKSNNPVNTVGELNRLISKSVPKGNTPKHPSRRVFQALRIAVNDEIRSLGEGLTVAINLLKPNSDSRLVVVSFHSLEDREVKEFFKSEEHAKRVEILTPKPIVPSDEELSRNTRSRSAKMRAINKV